VILQSKPKTDTSALEARNGKDIQGIPWERLNFSRDEYRETRLKQYKNYENLSRSREDLDKVPFFYRQVLVYLFMNKLRVILDNEVVFSMVIYLFVYFVGYVISYNLPSFHLFKHFFMQEGRFLVVL
jgi:hypothetical protein